MTSVLAFSARTALPTVTTGIRRHIHIALHRLSTSTMHEHDPELLDLEKRKNLAGLQYKSSSPIPSAPGWNEYLASFSEAAVKADRDTTMLDELQQLSVQFLHDRYHTDIEDSCEGTVETSYEREEVQGPLAWNA